MPSMSIGLVMVVVVVVVVVADRDGQTTRLELLFKQVSEERSKPDQLASMGE